MMEEGKSSVLTIGVNAYPEAAMEDFTWEKSGPKVITIPRLNRTVSGTRIAAEGGSLTHDLLVSVLWSTSNIRLCRASR